jgi:hypothetical protein
MTGKIKRQTEQKRPEKKKGGAAGGLAAPPKGGHVFMDVTSGRKQETGKTGSVKGIYARPPNKP